MKVTRRQLKSTLESVADRPVPEADPFFLDALEHRLSSGRIGFDQLHPTGGRDLPSPTPGDSYLAPVIPLRRTRPLVGAAAAVFVLGIGTVAVAAPWHQSTSRVQTATQVDQSAPPLPSTAATSGPLVSTPTTLLVVPTSGGSVLVEPPTVDQTTQVPTSVLSPTGVPATTKLAGTGSSPTAPGSSLTSDARPEPATTLRPTTASPTSVVVSTPGPQTNAPQTTIAPARTTVAVTTSTTEASVPAALSISCTVISSTSVRCTWSRSTNPSVTGYRLLRGVASGPGRVFSTGPGDTTYTDAIASPGTDYTYLVHAVRADGTSVAHSPAAAIRCCTPA